MRHGLHHKKLNRTSEHRKSLIKNMLNSLIKYEQITTKLIADTNSTKKYLISILVEQCLHFAFKNK